MPRHDPFIAPFDQAQRVQPNFEHYLDPTRVTVAGLTGQTHVAALCVQKVAEAGQAQRERGMTEGPEVVAWSALSLTSTGANGAALLREFLRAERRLEELGHTALMEEAWFRAGSPPNWQPVTLRTYYAHPTISGDPVDINQLAEDLIHSRLTNEFRLRSGVLEPVVQATRSSPAFVVPSVDEELGGRLIWSEPFIAHNVRFSGDIMRLLPNMDRVAVDVVLPSSGFDRSASVHVRVRTHTLAVLMAYEVEEIWRALDSTLPADVGMPFASSCFKVFNLLLLYDLYKSNPTASVCSLHNFAAFARHAATSWLGNDGYRRMYDWIMRDFAPQQPGSRIGREPLAESFVNFWTLYKVWPSLYDEHLSATRRDSHHRAVAGLLRDAFALIHTLIARHPPADSTSPHPPHPHPAFVPGSRNP